MSWPTIFATLGGGNQPLSLIDAMFTQVAAMVAIPCTASGTNSITLSPIGNAPSSANLGSYSNFNTFSFLAAGTSSSSVTAQFGSLANLPVYRADGTTQATTGDLVSGRPYTLMYAASLNSGGGGFYLLRPALQPSGGQPTYQRFLSGSGATYTTPANCLQLRIRMVGGGGGGAFSPSNGTGGGASSFGSTTANGGAGGLSAGSGGAGGSGGTTATGTEIARIAGGGGEIGLTNASGAASISANSRGGGTPFGISGTSPSANTGEGGRADGTVSSGSQIPGGGGGGEYVEFFISNPAATYTYTVGTGGASGGGSSQAGAAGVIYVEERYQD